MDDKKRLDHLLVEQGFFESRSRARDAVMRGTVNVNGVVVTKPGQTFNRDMAFEVVDPARHYVSRAALKLIAGLDCFIPVIEGMTVLDIGASTGGFTQVLLERGACHVTAIDVGHGQFHASLQGDTRITLMEGVNARDLEAVQLPYPVVDLVVSDVSFISLKIALPPALACVRKGGYALLLVKPQFEVGREGIGKGGLLKDPSLGKAVAQELFSWLDGLDSWQAKGVIESPIEGGDGNHEYLLYGEKTA